MSGRSTDWYVLSLALNSVTEVKAGNSPHPSWASWRGHFPFPEEAQRPEAGDSSAAHRELTGSTPPMERNTKKKRKLQIFRIGHYKRNTSELSLTVPSPPQASILRFGTLRYNSNLTNHKMHKAERGTIAEKRQSYSAAGTADWCWVGGFGAMSWKLLNSWALCLNKRGDD